MEDFNMSVRRVPPLTDDSRDLQKQIGCMNGIFQLFDRHHFLAARRGSSHRHKRLLQGPQHQQDYKSMKAAMEKGLEMQKEKPRTSTESSRASYSSSTCSTSTFSSIDCSKVAQPDALPLKLINIPESTFLATATKEQQPSSAKSTQSLDLQDVVKDSVYREARALPVKSRIANERRGKVMKHIDSPRPSLQLDSEKTKLRGCEGLAHVPGKPRESTRNTKERLALPRFSYDGKESQETIKWGGKHKEHPRLSLDSKTSSMKYSALESRSNFLVRDQNKEQVTFSDVLPINEESGSHHRSSSIVAKLMGLEEFPDAISLHENSTPTLQSYAKEAFLSHMVSSAEQSKSSQVTHSPRILQTNHASPSSRQSDANFVRKLRFPTEPAPWKQQDCSQGSPKMALQTRKAATDTKRQTLSVYGEIEKRIAELEFKKSGKDLRALKRILEAMEKTREQMENQRGESAGAALQMTCSVEGSCSDQNSSLSSWKDGKNHGRVLIKGPGTQRPLGPPVMIMKPDKTTDRVNLPYSTQISAAEMPQLWRVQTQEPKYNRENSGQRQRAKDFSPKNNLKDSMEHFLSPGKKTTWRTPEQGRTSGRAQHITVENCTTSGRNSGTTSPRLQQNPLRTGPSRPSTSLSDSRDVRKSHGKKIINKGSQNKKTKVRAKDLQLSDDQLSELSSETRYSSYQGDTASVKSESNNSLVSLTETEIASLAHSTNINAEQKKNYVPRTRKHKPAVDNIATTVEQPSPISVLDDSFYCEDSPSPVKKTSTAFQDDISSPGEAEWHLEDQKIITECRRPDQGCEYIKQVEGGRHPIQELRSLHNYPDEASTLLVSGCGQNPDHVYINKVLLTSGLLKNSSFISTTEQLVSSSHLINPDMFHVIEQSEEALGNFHGEVIDKNEKTTSDKKIQRRIIFDMVDEILVRKINSGRFAGGKKTTSPQLLLDEIYTEMDYVSQISNCNLDNAEDEITRLLIADMKYQSEDWADYRGEVPAVVLAIERLIFKDLINEVVIGKGMEVRDWPNRQLFRQ
ncbi:protein LONGIFOLIA 2-like [Andrographis paniculata]|uniref:protein LONGIFOLIA 2-like n=1 Tax=Andrographis paniculata TaxID=175694 RepID=UPI0021E81281|nr:protein LONGIFOLIA 2-like [Andrographis paniculata]